MALILNIETATTACSVAIAENGKAIASQESHESHVHAEKITVFIEKVLKQAAMPFSALDAIAIGSGPGSYTGLRIGTATAKGLCYALEKPLIAIPTLKAMAMAAAQKLNDTGALYCPMIDARRLEVYTALYDYTGNEVLPVHARILDEKSFAEYKTVAFFGDGMPKMKNLFADDKNKLWIDDMYASALNMCRMAEDMYHSRAFSNVAYYEPFYLKDFVAGKGSAAAPVQK